MAIGENPSNIVNRAQKTLIHILPSNRWGGIERYALDICRHFTGLGWNVVAVTKDAKAVDALFEKAGVPLLHAPFGSMFDFQSIGLITREIKKSEGEVIIHTHGSPTAFTALAARRLARKPETKVLMTRHKVKKANESWFFRKIYSSLDAIIFVSHLAKDRFLSPWEARVSPFDNDKLHVIHNSINIPLKTPGPRERKGPITAMFHGPVIPGKGLETIIDALQFLKDSRIRIKIMGAGPPDYADRLRRRAMALGVMDSIDWVRHSDFPMEMIDECDFGVLPSVKEEAFGLANIEYMACGKPQICSLNGAQQEYITDGREGVLIPPGNPAKLAEAIRRLGADPSLREQMGHKAYETFINHLSWDKFIDKLSPLY